MRMPTKIMGDKELFKLIFPEMNIDGMSDDALRPLFNSDAFTMAKLNYYIKQRPVVAKLGYRIFKLIELWKTMKERLLKFIS